MIKMIVFFILGAVVSLLAVLYLEDNHPRVCEKTVFLPPSDCDCPAPTPYVTPEFTLEYNTEWTVDNMIIRLTGEKPNKIYHYGDLIGEIRKGVIYIEKDHFKLVDEVRP